jgi:NAD+ synthase
MDAARDIGLTSEQVERVYRDIEAKRRVARYLHHVPRPLLDDPGA